MYRESPMMCWTRATHLTSQGGASGRDPGGSLQSAQFQQHLAPGALQDHSTYVDARTVALCLLTRILSNTLSHTFENLYTRAKT